ncbi:hypothetical protein [Priestia aryabhattai]|uniref:hypothetical protein n=1 Tax=Priestia aryabhattai TaxID=412384 RepID=UPI001C8D7448|nr:hypothetical protein [Priestia aryabhattai]MBX9998179.1 hypothetical protein [Priestia aryabhattai]
MPLFRMLPLRLFIPKFIIVSIICCGFLSLFYSSGFMRYYNLTPDFINFSLDNFKNIIGYTLAGLFFIAALGVFIKLAIDKVSFSKPQKVKNLYFFITSALIFLLISTLSISTLNYPLDDLFRSQPILPAFFVSILLLTTNKSIKTLPIICLALLLSLSWASYTGKATAANKENYLVFSNDNKDYVVLSKYNDGIIIAPVDLKKKSIEPSFQIIDSSEVSHFDYKNTGVLTPKPPLTIQD